MIILSSQTSFHVSLAFMTTSCDAQKHMPQSANSQLVLLASSRDVVCLRERGSCSNGSASSIEYGTRPISPARNTTSLTCK